VYLLGVFEYIQQLHDVWVLAHLEHLDFITQHAQLLLADLGLLNLFDCDKLARLLILGLLDVAKLPLSEHLPKVEESLDVLVSRSLLEHSHPQFLLVLRGEVDHSGLDGPQTDLNWVDLSLDFLSGVFFRGDERVHRWFERHEGALQQVHDLVRVRLPRSLDVQLISHDNQELLLELVGGGLQKSVPLHCLVLVLILQPEGKVLDAVGHPTLDVLHWEHGLGVGRQLAEFVH